MATRTFSTQAIKTAAHYLKEAAGNTAVAAHQCEVQITAIAPYMAAHLNSAHRILRSFSAEKIQAARAKIAEREAAEAAGKGEAAQ